MTAILGFISALALLILAVFLGGSPDIFVNTQGLLIVVLGTMAVTTISFRAEDLKAIPKTVGQLLKSRNPDVGEAAEKMVILSERARKNGLLSLENDDDYYGRNIFLEKAMRLVIDGANGDEVEHIMEREAAAIESRALKMVDILRRAGEVAPAMGLIGTLVGLIQMLGSLNDPSTIGPNMAVALITTFYGAVLAHFVFLPLAARAERLSSEDALLHNIYITGAASIGDKENPRRLEDKVNAILPPVAQIRYFA